MSTATITPPSDLLTAFAQSAGDLSEAARTFVLQAQDDWAADELPDMTQADIGQALADFWRFGELHDGDSEPAIRIRRAPHTAARPPCDLLEIAQPDCPFLVDSVMAAIA